MPDLLSERYDYLGPQYLDPLPSDDPSRFADLSCLPYADAEYDVVIVQDVLEHVKCYMSAIEEMHRVLKPGGLALVSVPMDRGLAVVASDYVPTDRPVHGARTLVSPGACKAYRMFGPKLVDFIRGSGFCEVQLHEFEVIRAIRSEV
jgi:SAM-dependent methyltransferase